MLLNLWKTWHIEAVVMAALLTLAALVSGPASAWEWLGAAAIFAGTRHMSVADRLREVTAERLRELDDPPTVSCIAWLVRYWWVEKALLLGYCVALGSWVAFAGGAIFTLYPPWRRVYRRWHRKHATSSA